MEQQHFSHIRSFVKRASRMTATQEAGYQRLCNYGLQLDSEGKWDFGTSFGRQAPTVVEIGFGMGDATLEIAQNHPDWNFVGIEVHKPGLGALVNGIETLGMENLRVVEGDAAQLLVHHLLPRSLRAIHLFFPDPWQKKRHHKRRLIVAHRMAFWLSLIETRGYLYMVTDWADYAQWIYEHMGQLKLGSFEVLDLSQLPIERPQTKFESKGLSKGHDIREFVLRPLDQG